MPFAIEISTASRAHYFRAANRGEQLEWLAELRAAVELATQNEYISIAELLITDEEQRHATAEQRAKRAASQHAASRDADRLARELARQP